MRLGLIIWTLVLFITLTGEAQDYNLSQYHVVPQLSNPAESGMITRDFRAHAGYRNQWRAISNAFETSMASYDMPLLRKRVESSYFGAGIVVVRDKAGKSALGTMEAKGTVAYHIAMNRYSSLSAGVLIGYTQRTINLSDLSWDSQFNGVGYDPVLNDNEFINHDSRGYVESAVGLHWLHRKEIKYALGYSAFHYGQNQSFLRGENDKLFFRQVFTAELQNTINALDATYFVRAQKQSGALEIQGGFRTKYRVGVDSRYTNVKTSSALMAGVMYRWRDAIVPLLGYEFKKAALVWISYDINISPLKTATNLRGGWEIHLVYMGVLKDRRVKLR
jgi:type IX secretion system PorP/SprF family membrane protein